MMPLLPWLGFLTIFQNMAATGQKFLLPDILQEDT